MTAIGILGFADRLVSRSVHPYRSWIDGWNFSSSHNYIRGVGDLDNDGRADVVVSSDWGTGVMRHDGSAFRCPIGIPRDTMLGDWRFDATNRAGRDRIVAVENFTGSARQEILVWSNTGMATLERTGASFLPSRIHTNGTRLGGWVLSTLDNHYRGCGRFGVGSQKTMVLTSPWGIGLISFAADTSLFMAPTRTRLGDWDLRIDRDRVELIGDFDGDGQDEIFITSEISGIAILKMIDGRLVSIAKHALASNIGGFIVESGANFVLKGRFNGGGRDEILVKDRRGLHVLSLNGARLERRAFVATGTRIDGWVINVLTDHLLATGDLTGDGAEDVLIRSPWGIGVLTVGKDNRFRVRTGHPYGAMIGDWQLDSSDIIAGAGRFLGGAKNDLLIVKPSAGSAAEPAFANTEFVNWHRNIRRALPTVQPRNLTELVNAVRIIQARGGSAGIAGSGWSYTDCVVGERTRSLIDTSLLNSTLGGLLPAIIDDRSRKPGNRFVHVEAGVKLYDLNCRLDRLGLALPTLGGSRGQSLAGALSTGVHGADVSLPPIADAVRAIHLVGAGGQQWWIEPNANGMSDVVSLFRGDFVNSAKARGILDSTVTTVFDDAWFNAVLVSMGCAGVIYSVVLECRPTFRLRSTTVAESWVQAQQRIRDLPRSDLRPRYLEINVNPADGSCLVTTRVETTEAITPPASSAGPSIGEIVAAAGLIGPAALGLFFGAIGDYIGRTTAEIVALGFVPFAGPVLQAQKTAEALKPVEDAHRLLVELGLAAVDPHNPRRVADVLPTALNLIWAIGAFVVSGRTIVDQIQSQLTSQQRPIGSAVNTSFGGMTGQPLCSTDGAQAHDETARLVESFEYAVADSRAIAFVDRLIAVIGEQRRGSDAIVVNLNLRFTGRTRATLGTQMFERTCHVEIYTFRGLRGNDAFKRRMQDVVREFQAVPHWGQLHNPSEADVFRDTGALARWQRPINAISGSSQMFWSDFARARRLLP